MTTPGNLVCTKCGFSNVPGDQFCGSCGAFLEWEGVTAGPPARPPVTPAGVPVEGPPPGQTAATAATTAAAAPAAPAGQAPVVPEPAASTTGRLTRCPACGIANEPGRTFCQSCGTRLPESAGVPTASASQIAAAVAAPNQPAVSTTRGPAADPAASSRGGGLLKWLIVVGVLGILVGVAVVAGPSLLRGSASSDASTNPSLAALASSASGAPRASAGGSGAPGSSRPSSVSVPLVLTAATASSVVGDLSKFQPAKAIDGDPATCWQEGNATEKGQWIEVAFPASRVTSLIVTNGYNASRDLYRGNHRLKDVQISVDGREPTTVRLKDVGTPQRVDVPPVDGATKVRITMVTVYPAVKTKVAGTPFDDAALGEIVVMGVTPP